MTNEDTASEVGMRTPAAGLDSAFGRLRDSAPGPDVDDLETIAVNAEREARWDRTIPARFRRARVGDLDPEVRDVVLEWVDGLTFARARNLVIVGPVGTGKTHAAIAAARLLFEDSWNVSFAPLVEILEALRPNAIPAQRDWRSVGLLVIDDLGTEKASEWTGEQLYSIVNRRWLEERPTIVTSNLTVEQLTSTIDERVYSRLVDGATAVRLSGDDRRRS